MKDFIWHNGELKTSDTPILTAHDRLRLGEGVFNTILVLNGKLHFAAEHFDKLLESAKLFWPHWCAPAASELITAARSLLQKNKITTGHYALNCTITGGEGGRGLLTPNNVAPNTIMRAAPFTPKTQPIKTIIATTTRRNEGSPLSNIKYSNYMDNILALREAAQNGAEDAILLNNAGNICCATTANIAIIKDGQFITPPLSDGAQNGLTRARLIAQHNAIERSISPAELLECQGIYLLNSLHGAIEITTLDNKKIPAPVITLSKDLNFDTI